MSLKTEFDGISLLDQTLVLITGKVSDATALMIRKIILATSDHGLTLTITMITLARSSQHVTS
jgi:hypothetical protein